MIKSIKFLLVLAVVFSSCKAKYPSLENGLYADIQTNRGDILVKLHHKEVPMTVANFVALAEGSHPKLADSLQGKPFYDGITFHRVVENFMAQTGDPTATGRGNAGYRFNNEFPINSEGELLYKHDKAGVLSMANSGPNTNSSQFFITHKDTPWLDGKHSIFGQVQIGQPVVDSIKKSDYINKVDIIRVGTSAEEFNAPSVFNDELEKIKLKEEEEKRKAEEARKVLVEAFNADKNKAIQTSSGLKIFKIKEGTGKKVNPNVPTTAHYSLYLTDGTKVDSSVDRGVPLTFTVNDEKKPLIPGWKEGAKMMREGEKSRLYIPSYLGFGTVGRPPVIKPNTDLIFELEILKVGK